jgi:hypothetical protein
MPAWHVVQFESGIRTRISDLEKPNRLIGMKDFALSEIERPTIQVETL